MTVARGDVVLIDFPQEVGKPPKRRPAVVIQSDRNNSRLTDSIFAMITSNVSRAHEDTQDLVDVSTEEGRATGLQRNSVIKSEIIQTLPIRLVSRRIGRLSEPLLKALEAALQSSLALNK